MYESPSAAVAERHQSGADNRKGFYDHGVRKHRHTLVDSYRRVYSGFFSYVLEEFLTRVVSAHFWSSKDFRAHIPNFLLEERQPTYSRMALS